MSTPNTPRFPDRAVAVTPSDATHLPTALLDLRGCDRQCGRGACCRWEHQQGGFNTSHIPTTSTQVTRTADLVSLGGMSFASVYNQAEGTVICEAAHGSGNSAAVDWQVDDGTSANRHVSNCKSNLTAIFVASSSQAAFDGPDMALNEIRKSAFAYAVNNFALAVNGAMVGTDGAGSVPAGLSALRCGTGLNAGAMLNGRVRSLSYYARRLPDPILQSLST